jgi:phage terminase small subunit
MEVRDDSPSELTPKQERFCREYILDYNAARAARESGYSEESARQIGSENLSKPYIQAYITLLESDLATTLGITKSRVLNEHAKLAFSSIAHLHNTWIERKDFDTLTDEQKASIAEISTQTRTEKIYKGTKDEALVDIDYVKIKLYDKQRSLDSIRKILGFDAVQKIVNTNVNYNSELTRDEIKKISETLDSDV